MNVNPLEIAQFDRFAGEWWNPDGDFRTLHALNPVRLGFVQAQLNLTDQRMLDVGCGGGIFTEALHTAGARVSGADLAPESLKAARAHALENGLVIDYLERSVEALSVDFPGQFDAITCMELLEHVPDPQSIIHACARLLKPGGLLFLSTINRTPMSFAQAIVGAEYVLNLLPRGTHHYGQLIRPSELAQGLRQAGFTPRSLSGLTYNPLTRRARLVQSVEVNYLLSAQLGPA